MPKPARPAAGAAITGAQALVFVLYAVFLLGGVALSVVYAFAPLASENGMALALFVLIAAIVVFLHFAEGAEVAVTTMLARDHDQIDENLHSRIDTLNDHFEDFVTGRQVLVTISVLWLPFLCAYLQSLAMSLSSTSNSIPAWLRHVITFDQRRAYAYWFPVLSIFFLSQLYSKYIVQRRAETFFSRPATEIVIGASIWFGRLVRFGLPDWLIDIVVGTSRDPEAGASRQQMYRAQATYRDGVGQESVAIVLKVDPDTGAVHYTQVAKIRAFADGNQLITQEDVWTAPVLRTPEPNVRVADRGTCGKVGKPTVDYADGDKALKWDLKFPTRLKQGDWCSILTEYRLGAKTMSCSDTESDSFEYRLKRYPVKLLTVLVQLSSDKKTFTNTSLSAGDVSDDPVMNTRESTRLWNEREPEVTKDGLYFEVRYPLLPAVYKFSWNVIPSGD